MRAGGIVVPMNLLLKRREVAFYLTDPDAKLVLTWHEFEQEAIAGAEEAGAECIVVRPGEFERLLADAGPWEVSKRQRRGTTRRGYTGTAIRAERVVFSQS